MSRLSARDLVDELARIAEIARKQGPVGLEKVETDEPFLAKGIRYVADGYDLEFIRDISSATAIISDASRRRQQDLPRDRRLRAGLRHDRHPDRHGADVRQHDDPSKLGRSWRPPCWLRFTARWSPICSVFRSPTSCMASCSTRRPTARLSSTHSDDPRFQESGLVREMLLAYLPEKHRHEEGEPVPADL